MEDTRKGREGIGARDCHLTHHTDRDSTCLGYSHLYTGTGVTSSQLFSYLPVGSLYCEASDLNRSKAFYCHSSIRRDLQIMGFLRGPKDIDHYIIARPQYIIRGGGDVHVRLERERTLIEDVTSEDLLAIDQQVHRVLDIDIGTRVKITDLEFAAAQRIITIHGGIERITLCINPYGTIGLA